MGFFIAMKTRVGRAILALILVLAQMHFCQDTYVRASGETCLECLQLPLDSDNVSLTIDTHGDCHDCCEIKECETPNGLEVPANPPQFNFDFVILPEPIVLPDLGGAASVKQRFHHICGGPTNGPPLVHLSRGPPSPCAVQPSAGCGITLLA